jgi:hypothetical protein
VLTKKRGKRNRESGKLNLKVTYEVEGKVIRVIERKISEKYKWFLIGNPSWRDY